MRQDGRFLLQKNWLPQYSWNIVESGVEHHNPNLIYQLKIAIGIGGTSYKNNNFKSAPNNLQQIIYMTATIQWNILFYRKMKNNAKRTKIIQWVFVKILLNFLRPNEYHFYRWSCWLKFVYTHNVSDYFYLSKSIEF